MTGPSVARRYWRSLTGPPVAPEMSSEIRGRAGYPFWRRYWASFVGVALPATEDAEGTRSQARSSSPSWHDRTSTAADLLGRHHDRVIPPTGSLRYSDRDRRRDEKQGRADARNGLPLVLQQPVPTPAGAPAGSAALTVEVTPFLKRLYGEQEQALAELLAEHRSEEAPLFEELLATTEDHRHLLGRCEVIKERMAILDTPLTEEETTRRRGGEEKAGHSEEVVRGRRVDEWRREVRAAQAQLDALSDQAHQAGIAAGRAKDRLDALRKVTHAQGLAIISYYEQRKGSYLTGLAHQPRRGPELVRALVLFHPHMPSLDGLQALIEFQPPVLREVTGPAGRPLGRAPRTDVLHPHASREQTQTSQPVFGVIEPGGRGAR